MTAADPLAELHALRQRLAALKAASCLPTASSTAKRRIELFTPVASTFTAGRRLLGQHDGLPAFGVQRRVRWGWW